MKLNINKINESFNNKGFFYSTKDIYNLYISLKTKPFVILSGISGTGKSKIITLFAEIIREQMNHEDKNFELVPVKPNWTDSRDVFGFYNMITDVYETTPILKLFLRALKNPDIPYFLILDEMNMAKVEYYFADFLSLIESRKNTEDKKQNFLADISGLNSSEVTILAGLDMKLNGDYVLLSDLRDHKYVRLWKENYYNGKESNWLPMFRSNLNQNKDGVFSRLAGRIFEEDPNSKGLNRSYRFRSNKLLEQLNEEDRNKMNELKQLVEDYSELNEVLEQELLSLHDKNICIPSQNNYTWDGSESLGIDELYKSKKLIDNNVYFIPPKIPIPINLFVVGTVNIDETTHSFSTKVLDRSNVIEFNHVDIFNAYDLSDNLKATFDNETTKTNDLNLDEVDLLKVTIPSLESVNTLIKNYEQTAELLFKIFYALEKHKQHFGYRVINEISHYINNYSQYISNSSLIALDNQIVQKILPKFNGDQEEIESSLTAILNILLEYNKNTENVCFPKSINKLYDMLKTLRERGFVTFI